MTSLLQFLEDPRGPQEKGQLIIARGPPSFLIRIPPKRVVVVPVLEKSSETRRVHAK